MLRISSGETKFLHLRVSFKSLAFCSSQSLPVLLMCPGDTFVLYWWCLDAELDVIEHLKWFITRGIPILTTLTALPLTVLDNFFLWMWYCSKEILPWNRWQTDILICMVEQCPYCLKSKCINCFLSQNNLSSGYLNASVIEVEIFTFLSNIQCVFPKSQRRGKFLFSLFSSSLRRLSYSSNFYSLLIA